MNKFSGTSNLLAPDDKYYDTVVFYSAKGVYEIQRHSKQPKPGAIKLSFTLKTIPDKFSVTLKLRATDGKNYDTVLYSAKGIHDLLLPVGRPKEDFFSIADNY